MGKTIKNRIKGFASKLTDEACKLEFAAIREAKETKDASLILLKMAKGKDISKEEVKFLKAQSADIGKALALIGLQAVPFSSAAIIAIEVVARRHGFSIFPSSQSNTAH